MKNGIVIADTGPIFSLSILDKLDLLDSLFDEVYIPQSVWKELTFQKGQEFQKRIEIFFSSKVRNIVSENNLLDQMELGEAEAILLYKEMNAAFLLIDDKKARQFANTLKINSIGTLAILIKSKENNIIKELRPLFIQLLQNKRYYSISLLNSILSEYNENIIE